jgi:DNA-binding NarL/FixJ family response regulator
MPIAVSIVEDSDKLREMLVRVLNRADGFRCVSHYSNAEDALKDLPQAKPDVVLMDINLPGMNGVECVRHLKKIAPVIQVMMLTVYEDTENIWQRVQAATCSSVHRARSCSKLLMRLSAADRR